MGRLFWKIFFFSWLVNFLVAIGVAVAVWLSHPAHKEHEEEVIEDRPHIVWMISSAVATLRHGGVTTLRDMLTEWDHKPMPTLLAVNGRDEEILNRDIPPRALKIAREVIQKKHTEIRGGVVQEARDDHGDTWLFFVPVSMWRAFKNSVSMPPPLPFAPDRPPPPRLPLAQPMPPMMQPPFPPGGHQPAPWEAPTPPGADYPQQPPPPNRSGQPPPPPGAGHSRPPPPFFPPFLFPVLVSLLGSFISALLLAWYFAKPIRNLRNAFEEVAQGTLTIRIGKRMGKRRDELADLARDFDRMTERLQSLVENQRKLLHDVSHEMRSPLARLQAMIDLIRQQPERTLEFIERIEKESIRMDKLVGEILTLARLDSGMAGSFHDEIDLCEMVANMVDDAQLESEAKGCCVAYEHPVESMTMVGHYDLIYRAIENIIRNAVRYSPMHKTITVNLKPKANGQQVCLTVLDEGTGVPKEELERIFQPFVRLATTHAISGYGLGLALSHRVIHAHHGSITATNQTTGGFCMTINLPLLVPDKLINI